MVYRMHTFGTYAYQAYSMHMSCMYDSYRYLKVHTCNVPCTHVTSQSGIMVRMPQAIVPQLHGEQEDT